MTTITWAWIALGILILYSMLASAADTALSRAKRHELRDLAENGNHKAGRAYIIAEDSSKRLTIFQIASLTNSLFISGLLVYLVVLPVSENIKQQVAMTYDWALPIVFILVVFLLSLFLYILDYLLPSVLVWRNAEDAAVRFIGVAEFTIIIFTPFYTLMGALRKGLIDPMGDISESALVTEEEIMTLVDAGEEEGSIEEEEKEMIYSIFQLNETLVREIMVPRIDVIAIEIGATIQDALNVIIDAGHSRVPVYDNSLDKIIGLLYAKDLLELIKTDTEDVKIGEILRPAIFIPETKRAMELLSELQTKKVHLAIVIDEYGGTAGIVTIEDIVEEIVGEIFDEYDEDEEGLYEKVAENEYTFAARIDLDDFNRILNLDLSDEMGDTLGGYIYGNLGRVPVEGDVIEENNLKIRILTVDERRIQKVSVLRMESDFEQKLRNGKEHD